MRGVFLGGGAGRGADAALCTSALGAIASTLAVFVVVDVLVVLSASEDGSFSNGGAVTVPSLEGAGLLMLSVGLIILSDPNSFNKICEFAGALSDAACGAGATAGSTGMDRRFGGTGGRAFMEDGGDIISALLWGASSI